MLHEKTDLGVPPPRAGASQYMILRIGKQYELRVAAGFVHRISSMSKLKTMYARSRVPLYIQVASALRRRIETGQWQPGQKISTLEQLEQEFQVARVTVRQATELLQNEGLVQRQQGRGTFVSDKLQDKHWLQLGRRGNR